MLSVRLPDSDVRRFKSLGVSRGVSLQEAVHQALESWAAERNVVRQPDLDSLQGSLADVDVERLMRHEKESELEERF